MRTTRNLFLFLTFVSLIVISSVETGFAQVFSGFVTDMADDVQSDVQIEVVDHPEVAPVFSDVNGKFVLTGIPAGISYGMKFSKNGYVPLYTAMTQSYSDIYASFHNHFKVSSQADLVARGVIAGKGAIMSVTYDNNDTEIAAVVSATGSMHGTYPVSYGSNCDLASPDSSGLYCVINVENNDTITISASSPGYSFTPRFLQNDFPSV